MVLMSFNSFFEYFLFVFFLFFCCHFFLTSLAVFREYVINFCIYDYNNLNILKK